MSIYVPEVAPLSRRDIESEAEAVLWRFYPERMRHPGPFNVLHFFDHILPERYRLETGVADLSDGVEGITFPDGRVLVSEETYRNAANGVGRARFTVSHECYHGIKHRLQIRNILMNTGKLILHRRQFIRPFVDPEWQADTFASAILMPEPMVRCLVSRYTNRLQLQAAIVSEFQVSMEAACVRLKKIAA